ncbi:MAG: hypothetical protein ACR2OM_03930 [Aestuariivirgaceae bacterium]
MNTPTHSLTAIIAGNLERPLPAAVTQLADTIRQRHGTGVAAILVYGSCLRGTPPTDSLIDYYLLGDDATAISHNPASRWLCRLVPPNVYYAEESIDGVVYRAKYAALTLSQFERKVSPRARNPYFWARFAQPVALAHCRDEAARACVVAALSSAVTTMLANIAPLGQPGDNAVDLWSRGLAATYASELRSEPPGRARQVAEGNGDYYTAVTDAVLGDDWTLEQRTGTLNWAHVQRAGKLLSVVRLLKAAFTFRGGADYLAWKISRHSGQPVALSDWQRRHPILASLTLLPKLLKSGAVR